MNARFASSLEETHHARSDDPSHPRDAANSSSLADMMPAEIAEAGGERLGDGPADVADPERDEEVGRGLAREASIAATRFRAEISAKPSRPASCSMVEPVVVGGVGDEAVIDELADALLAESLDVHRSPRGEVGDPLHPLSRGSRG